MMQPSARRIQIWIVALILTIATTIEGQCTDGELRLVNGGTPFEGRLEVCLGNQWGTICDDYWKSNSFNAQVACRQLGFSDQGAITRVSNPNLFQPPPFGQGTGLIFLDDVRCTGSEQRLTECPHLSTPQGSQDCIHDEDVGVICQPLPTTPPPTTTRPPTRPMTEIDTNIFINIETNTTNIDIDASIDINIEQTTSQNSEDKAAKNMTKLSTSGAKSITTPTSLVTPQFEINNENEYIEFIVIVVPIGVLIILSSIILVIVVTCLLTNRSGRVTKSMENGDDELNTSDCIQDQEIHEVHYCTVDQNDSKIEAGSGKFVPNFSYDLRKAWQSPHKEIEAHINPAYAVAVYPGVVILQEENHHYETIVDAKKGAAKVYCNVGALIQDQHSTRPRD